MSVVAYYNLPYGRETSIEPRPSVDFDIMSDGTPRGRESTAKDVFDASILHPMITQAEANGLLAHYETNKLATISFVHAGKTYHLHYLGRPSIRTVNGVYRDATVRMVGSLADE